MEYLELATELVVGFIALFILTKILGKTQITQITAFDFISALVLGELVGNAIYDEKINITKILFAIALWGILIYVLEIITQKFRRSRKLLEGEPSIVIRKGKIQRDVLKKNKLDINQLQHLLRAKNAFSIQDVEFAILETDGQVSVLKTSEAANPSRKDLHLPQQNVILPVTIITDGELISENLKSIGRNENWLDQQIKSHGAESIREVLYAEYKQGESLYIQKYEKAR
ncbi:DUF421 domain-containing protein [Calidifontibacillus oryziterrae]|uniref:DUF421 domain-containing protein n=1 Tax=Calidifontibacillus oryziterrae TaxID=1191699 RepID=UPI0002DF2FB0|nr:DUF421 domain-containing protein [Calidifontibacillus oryziterrae]